MDVEEWFEGVVKAVGVITILWYAGKVWKWSMMVIVREHRHLKFKGLQWVREQREWWGRVVEEMRK